MYVSLSQEAITAALHYTLQQHATTCTVHVHADLCTRPTHFATCVHIIPQAMLIFKYAHYYAGILGTSPACRVLAIKSQNQDPLIPSMA